MAKYFQNPLVNFKQQIQDQNDDKIMRGNLSKYIGNPFVIHPPEPWVDTFWRRVQRMLFPKHYRAALSCNAKLWEQYIEKIDNLSKTTSVTEFFTQTTIPMVIYRI